MTVRGHHPGRGLRVGPGRHPRRADRQADRRGQPHHGRPDGGEYHHRGHQQPGPVRGRPDARRPDFGHARGRGRDRTVRERPGRDQPPGRDRLRHGHLSRDPGRPGHPRGRPGQGGQGGGRGRDPSTVTFDRPGHVGVRQGPVRQPISRGPGCRQRSKLAISTKVNGSDDLVTFGAGILVNGCVPGCPQSEHWQPVPGHRPGCGRLVPGLPGPGRARDQPGRDSPEQDGHHRPEHLRRRDGRDPP